MPCDLMYAFTLLPTQSVSRAARARRAGFLAFTVTSKDPFGAAFTVADSCGAARLKCLGRASVDRFSLTTLRPCVSESFTSTPRGPCSSTALRKPSSFTIAVESAFTRSFFDPLSSSSPPSVTTFQPSVASVGSSKSLTT